MSKLAKSVMVGDKEYVAKELDVMQVAELIEQLDNDKRSVHVIDFLFGDHMPAVAVAMSIGVTTEELSKLVDSPTEVIKLIDAVKEVNGFLSNALERKAQENAIFQKRLMDMTPDLLLKITQGISERKHKDSPVN